MKPIYLLFAAWQLVTASVVLGQTNEDSQKNAPQDIESPDAETIGSSLTADQILSASQKAKQPVPPWKVSPAAEPNPVFQYQFWPKESELRPGSGQLYYFRSLTLLQQKNGALPPQSVVDKNGRKLLSWRVLMLPYLGHIDFTQSSASTSRGTANGTAS